MSSYAAGKGTMRGLTLFISNVRHCSPEEEERLVKKEMAKIRKKLHEQKKSLDGYNRRKHVAKLLFMYLMGYEADFAYKDALRLCMSQKLPEKLIGYVTIGAVLHHDHPMLPEVLPCLKSDLVSGNEAHICLALAFIANIGGEKLADLVPNIKALISSSTGPMVTKKALLCMLRIFRDLPSAIGDDWITIFGRLLSAHNNNVGVLMAALSLLNALAAHTPSTYESLYGDVIGIYTRVITGKRYEQEYVYYSVPCPWLQIGIVKYLQNYPHPPSDHLNTVVDILTRIIQHAHTVSHEALSQKNTFYGILFECVSLVCILKHPGLMDITAKVLGAFLSDKTARPNHVYNGLAAIIKLARIYAPASKIIREYDQLLISNLSAEDVSIRRMCLDLVYGMCDKKSAGTIVYELLSYLQKSIEDSTFKDWSARDELVLKISMLAERYSQSYRWYVDVMLKLIMLAGDHMNDHVWYRTIKIITNQEDLQEYATQTLFVALQNPVCNPTVVKIACYILGEYGDMIATHPNCSPQILFQVVHSKFTTVSDDRTKAIILSTYMKFLNLFPVLAPTIMTIFDQYRSYVDSEIQQRACEYLAFAQMGDKEMLAQICEIMPAYEDFKADATDEFAEADSSEDDKTPIVFTPIVLPEDKPFVPIPVAAPAYDAEAKTRHQKELEEAAQVAAQQLQNDFNDKQKQLSEQERILKQAEFELQEKERKAKKKLEKLERKEKQKEEDTLRRREEQLRTKKEEIAQHFQTQALAAQEALQQQALLAQQQQIAILQEQQAQAERELQAAATRVIAQQEAEIQARKQKAEAELHTQLLAAKQAHDAAISQQGARAQLLLEKEQELIAMQNKIQVDYQAKQEEIQKEAERQAALAAQKVQQEQAIRAEQLRQAALIEQQKIKEKEAALAVEAARLREQEQRVKEAEQKERQLAAREAALLQQQALLVQQAQAAQEQMFRAKKQMEEEAAKERERIMQQQMLQQQEQQRLLAIAEAERQKLAMAAAKEQEKLKMQQVQLQQQAAFAAQALEQEKQKAMALAALAEKEKQEAERQRQVALQQQAAAALQAQQANALSLAQQQASAMAAAVEQSRLKALQSLTTANSLERQAEMARKLSVMQEGVMMEEAALQIGMKSQYQTGKGRMEIFFTNKTQMPFTQLTIQFPPVPYLTSQIQPPQSNLGPGQQTSCVLIFSCDAPFDTYPELAISFSASGATQSAKIKLPITITRFCDPLPLDAATFSTRWVQINGPPQETVETFQAVNPPVPEHVAGLFTSGFRWAILPGVDPNPNNLVGAATFHSSRGSVYCYMRLETNQQANAIRLTLKSGSAEITNAMKNVFLAHLSKEHQKAVPASTPASPAPVPANPFATNSPHVPPAVAANPFATNVVKPAPAASPSPFLTNSIPSQIAFQTSPAQPAGFGQYGTPVVALATNPGGASIQANPFATVGGRPSPAAPWPGAQPQATQSVAHLLTTPPPNNLYRS